MGSLFHKNRHKGDAKNPRSPVRKKSTRVRKKVLATAGEGITLEYMRGTTSHGNYPDNIRSFDNDPRSPFYRDYRGEAEEALIEEFETKFSDMLDRLDALGFPYKVDAECSDYCEYRASWGEAQITRVCPETGNVYGAAVDPEDMDAFMADLDLTDPDAALERAIRYFDTGE